MLKLIASVTVTAAGAALLWFDYSFTVLGEEKSFGRAFIFAEPVKVFYLAILLIAAGIAGLVFFMRDPVFRGHDGR